MKALFLTLTTFFLCTGLALGQDSDQGANQTPKKSIKLNTTKSRTNAKPGKTKTRKKATVKLKTTKSTATRKPTVRIQSKAVSEVLPRLNRSNIQAAGKTAAKDVIAKTKIQSTKVIQPKSILKKPSISRQATAKKPTSALKGKANLNSQLTARKPIQPNKKITFNKKVEVKKIPSKSTKKLGGSKTAKLNRPVVSNKPIAAQATSKRPNSLRGQKPSATTSKLSSSTKKTGKALKGVKKLPVGKLATAGLIGGGVSSISNTKKLRDSGQLTKSQYNKAQLTNATKLGGEVMKLKKLNPTALLMNDTLGTDPISLGVEGIGDLINGTDNAKQSLKGVKSAWNKSLTKQTFTDPKGAAKRVGNDLKQAGNDVKQFSQKAGKNIGKAGKTVGKEAKKVTKAVGKKVDKAKGAIGKAGKKTGNFFKGVFKKKKKK